MGKPDVAAWAEPVSARFPVVARGEIGRYRGKFPVLVSDGGGGSLIYVRERGWVTRCCGEPAGDSVRSHVWSGTRNSELARFGAGAVIHNLYTACDHCGGVEAS